MQWATGKRKASDISPETRRIIGLKAWATRVKRGNAVSGAKGKHWKLSAENRRNQSLAQRGENSPHWQGGKTEKGKTLRKSVEWKLWREAVFTRDDYTCQMCGVRGGVELHPDHIKPFSQFPELRFDIANGRTLCAPCHRTTPTFGWRLVNSSSHV
jgi:hypothetical protein